MKSIVLVIQLTAFPDQLAACKVVSDYGGVMYIAIFSV